MAGTVHALDFLAAPDEYPAAACCVVFGDEPFLKRLVLDVLRCGVLGTDETDTPFASFDGRSVECRDVMDEVATVSLFGGERRLVIVDEADDFVSKHRGTLEDYVARPKRGSVLILEVSRWQGNTRLFKAVAKSGLQIECRVPEKQVGRRKTLDQKRLTEWLADWAKSRHGASLESAAAALLTERIGPDLGLLDQELAKLALYTDPDGSITPQMVRDLAGGWRTKTTWEMIDAAAEGNACEALDQLERLLQSGENALALLGQISWSLRRFASAARIVERAERHGRRSSLAGALEQAGFRKWPPQAMELAERQLRQLGRGRAEMLFRWLLDADLSLKGTHSTPDRARIVLERLIVEMSKQADSRQRQGKLAAV